MSTKELAFRLREGAYGESDPKPVYVGEEVAVYEQRTYALEFPSVPTPAVEARLAELQFQRLTDRLGTLNFGNFVGEAQLAGVHLHVCSSKLGNGGLAGLLGETVTLASELIYGWSGKTAFRALRRGLRLRRVPYHDLLLVRHAVLGANPGNRLEDALLAIAASPTRRFSVEWLRVQIEHARSSRTRALTEIVHHPEELIPLPPSHPLAGSALAQRLVRPGTGEQFLPMRVREPVNRLVYDTPENRFVVGLLATCSELVSRFHRDERVGLGLRRDCRQMQLVLDELRRAPFLEGVPPWQGTPQPSQVLLKQAGYRECFDLHRRLTEGLEWPSQAQNEAERFLDGKDVATLYEYWVFLKTAQALTALTGTGHPRLRLEADDLGVLLAQGLELDFGGNLRLVYNRGYSHKKEESYSASFRPDVAVLLNDAEHVLDAKYKLDRVVVGDEIDQNDGAIEAEEEYSQTFRRGDLYKMHAYRDALARVRSAWIVYPGTEFRYYGAAGVLAKDPEALGGIAADGVGAIPLRPGVEPTALKTVLSRLLSK